MPIVEKYEEEIEEPQMPIDVDTGEENLNFIYDEQERLNAELITEDEEIVEMPSKMKKNEIFDIPDDPPVKQRKKRPPMTEEHKAKLKLAREKALATRRANAKEKKELKDLEKRAKQKKKDDLKKYVEGDEPKQEKVIEKHVTPEVDVEKAVLDGIMKYESIRKQRKKKKQEEMVVKNDEEKVKKQINHALQQNTPLYYGQQGYFDNCF